MWVFPGADGKNLPAMKETQARFLGWEDPLKKGMAGALAPPGHRAGRRHHEDLDFGACL